MPQGNGVSATVPISASVGEEGGHLRLPRILAARRQEGVEGGEPRSQEPANMAHIKQSRPDSGQFGMTYYLANKVTKQMY